MAQYSLTYSSSLLKSGMHNVRYVNYNDEWRKC